MPPRRLPHPEYKEQVRAVSTLRLDPLIAFVRATPVLSRAAQLRLVRSPHRRVRTALAEHPSLLPEVQPVLATDYNQYVRRALAGSKQLSPEAAQLLYTSWTGPDFKGSWPYVVRSLAANPATKPALLETIFEELSSWAVEPYELRMIGLALLCNPVVPLERFGPVSYLSDHEQFVAAKRPGLSLDQLGLFQARNIHQSVLERTLLSHPALRLIVGLAKVWEATLNDLLAFASEHLVSFSLVEEEVFLRLLPEWSGEFVDLVSASRSLARV